MAPKRFHYTACLFANLRAKPSLQGEFRLPEAPSYFGKPIQLTMLLRWMADEPPKIGSASESRT